VASIRADPDSAITQHYRRQHFDPLILRTEERLPTSTMPLQLTALAHLDGNSVHDR
jgi:hypothetical protein